MFLTKLKVISVVLLMAGALVTVTAGARGATGIRIKTGTDGGSSPTRRCPTARRRAMAGSRSSHRPPHTSGRPAT